MKKIKSILVILTVLCMIMYIVPLNVFAEPADPESEQQDTPAQILLRDALSIEVSNDKTTAAVNFENGTVTVSGGTNLVKGQIDDWDFGNAIGTMHYLYTDSVSLTFTTNPSEGFESSYFMGGSIHEIEDNTVVLSDLAVNSQYDIQFMFQSQNTPGGNEGTPSENVVVQFDGYQSHNEGVVTLQVGEAVVEITVTGTTISGDGKVTIPRNNLGSVTFTLGEGFTNEMNVSVLDGPYNKVLAINNNEVSLSGLDNELPDSVHFCISVVNPEPGQGDDPEPGQGDNNTNATSTINFNVTGAIEYREESISTGVGFMINNTRYEMDSTKADFSEILAYERDDNGEYILNENNEKIPMMNPDNLSVQMYEKTGVTISGDSITYNYDSSTNKVSFKFYTQWDGIITSIKINDYTVPANLLPQTSEQLINAYNTQRIEVTVDNIDKADTYNIDVTAKMQNRNEKIMGNFLWDYNANGGYTAPDDKIANATLTFVKAEFNGTTITSVEQLNGLGGLYRWDDAVKKNTYADERESVGSATFPVGTELTLVLIPDSGYQLVEFLINGGRFTAEDEIGTYTFTVPSGNFHLSATFEQVDDVVKSNSNIVDNGSITLGGTESSMNNGTARLDVDDISLETGQISNFENAVSTQKGEGYSISNYLDISLYNTVYKGSAASSWDTRVRDLENNATITLQLEDGVVGSDVVIVHEKHDGSYEIIETTYNAADNTISFVTNSFSNYAIASKGLIHVSAKAATCTEDGNIEYYKSQDGTKYYEDASGTIEITDITIPATEHDWNEWVVTKEPTTTEKGERTRTCKNDSTHTETEEIPMLEQSNTGSGSGSSSNTNPSTEPEVNPGTGSQDKTDIVVEPETNTPEANKAAEEVAELIAEVINGEDVEGISEELQEAIVEALQQGKELKVVVSMPEVKESDVQEDANKVKQYIDEDTNVGAYYNIDVLLIIDGEAQAETITSLNHKIRVTVPIPTDLPAVPEGYTRQFTIIRVHDGVAEALETTFENNSASCDTNLFSTYVLTYKDVKIADASSTETPATSDDNNSNGATTNGNNTTEQNTEKTANTTANQANSTKANGANPITGDNIFMYVSLIIFAVAGILVTKRLAKQNRRNK